jgi:FXSXX-COOH protein
VPVEAVTPDLESDIVDISGISLSALKAANDSVLARSIERAVRESAVGDDVIAGFESSI